LTLQFRPKNIILLASFNTT